MIDQTGNKTDSIVGSVSSRFVFGVVLIDRLDDARSQFGAFTRWNDIWNDTVSLFLDLVAVGIQYRVVLVHRKSLGGNRPG